MLTIITNKYFQVSYLLLIPLLCVGLLWWKGFNLGSEFTSANVLEIRLEAEASTNEILDLTTDVGTPEKTVVLDDGFSLYYRNVNLDELEGLAESLQVEEAVSSVEIFVVNGEENYLLAQRFFSTLLFALLLFLVFSLVFYRGSKVLLAKLFYLPVTNLLLGLHSLLILFAFQSLWGFFSLSVSVFLLVINFTALLAVLILNFYLESLFLVKADNNMAQYQRRWWDLVETQRGILMLISCALALLLVVPWMVLGVSFLFNTITLVIVISFALFNFVIVKTVVLGLFYRFEAKTGTTSRIPYLQKTW